MASLSSPKASLAHTPADPLPPLIDGLPIMVFGLSPEGLFSFWNSECMRVTGYQADEVLHRPGMPQQVFVNQEVIHEWLADWDEHSMNSGCRRHWEGPLRTRDDTLHYVSIHYRLRNAVVPGLNLWCIGVDVTQQVVQRQALKADEERLSLATQTARMGFWDWNAHDNEVFYSPECFRLIGYEWMEFAPSYEKWHEWTHPQDRVPILNRVTDCVENRCGEFEVEFRMRTKTGAYIHMFTKGRAFERDATGRATRLVGIVFDISTRKRTEHDLKAALAKVEELKQELEEENLQLKQELLGSFQFEDIISISESYRSVLRQVEQVAVTDTTVLILGETGTGKTLIAKNIHRMSRRADKPLVTVNCAALPENLIESELFGHEKGAFTGAYARKEGRFERADKGTIFLDEIGELPLDLQAKLLRVLQDGEFEPLGSHATRKVDVRVVAATNRHLEALVREGGFRPDLYYRLNVFPIANPPLRERKEDIPLLVRYFLNKFNAKTNKHIAIISKKTMRLLEDHHWPGNIRELENTIERAVVLSNGTRLEIGEWFGGSFGSVAEDFLGAAQADDAFDTLEELEKKHILAALQRTEGRVTGPRGAGRLLGLNDKTLQSRMRKLDIQRRNQYI